MKPEKALNIVAGMCSRKEYCSGDIMEKLRKWELPEEEIQKIMTFLSQHGFIDDLRFAKAYAEDKFRFNHWGKQKIALMLRQKHLSTEIIAEALAAIDTRLYEAGCLATLRQKLATLPGQAPYQLKAKLLRFGLSRGYDYELLHRCVDQLLEGCDDSDEIPV